MSLICTLKRHQLGPARLDAEGAAWSECVRCTRRVKLGVDLRPSDHLTARLASAREELGGSWLLFAPARRTRRYGRYFVGRSSVVAMQDQAARNGAAARRRGDRAVFERSRAA